MNFCRTLSVLLMFSAIYFAPKTLAKDEWIKVRSKNFQLFGNAGQDDIRQVANKLEQFREVFRQFSGKENFNSPIPTNIIVFKNNESFRDFKSVNKKDNLTDRTEAYFQGGEAVNYIALSIKGDKAKTYRTIFHDYAHFLVDNEIGRTNAPVWFNEGLAEYYELSEIEVDRRITLGVVNDEHLHLLRQNNLIPFESFFNFNDYSLHLQSNENEQIFYAQAWALVHYLLQSNNGARNPQFNKFVDFIRSGKSSKEAFKEAFQINFAALERELAEYINQKNFHVTISTFKDKLDPNNEMQSFSVSEAEAKAVLGNLLYHINRLEAATAILEEALKLDAGSGPANISLGLVRLRQKNFTEARKYLEKAISLDGKNYLAHYQYAYVLSREGMSDYGFVSGYDFGRTEKMRESLKKAIALNPDFAPSYSLDAFISVVRNEEIDEGIAYVKKALLLAPGNQWFQIRSAELLMRKEEFTNARRIAQKIFQTAPDEELRVYAQNSINLINSLEAQLIAIKNYNDRLKTEIPDKLLTDEEFALLRELAILESINQNLRKPRTDEIRVLGYLTKIVCGEKGIEYFVKIDKKIIKLVSKDFDKLTLVSFAKEMSNVQLGCETTGNEAFAVITYQPDKNTAAKIAGEILSIEFVPQNFKFLK